MSELLAILTTFGLGLGATAALAVCLEQRQLAHDHSDDGSDVRGIFITITASGYVASTKTFRAGEI